MTRLAHIGIPAPGPAIPARRKGRPSAGGSAGVGAQRLIDVACDLLRELPPERITRAEVARRAGVAPALIRYHFTDNHSLLRATASALSARFQAEAAAAIDPDAAPTEQLRTRIEIFLRFQIAFPFFHRLMTEELIGSQDDEARRLLGDVSTRGAAAYRGILDAGMDRGQMRAVDPALFYLAIIGFAELASTGRGILRELAHPGADMSDDDYAARCSSFIVDLFLEGLRKR